MSVERVIESMRSVRFYEQELYKAKADLFPVGSEQICYKGKNAVVVRVIHNDPDGERVVVRNEKTGKQYAVDYYYLIKDYFTKMYGDVHLGAKNKE